MAEPPSVIAIASLDKTFTSARQRVVALEDITLSVAAGEFVTLLGPSGCGKSTLLRLIADLESATSGTIVVNGKSPSQARRARDYGMVFQQAGLLDWRTVAGNIELPLKVMGHARPARAQRVAEMLDLVRLSDFADHHPWQLSGGMQQRVAIARALAFEPALLLMDEPLGALDEMNREYLQGELRRIQAATRTTIVFVTHSVTEAVFLSDRVIVMSPRPGRVAHVIPVELGDQRDESTRADPAFFDLVTRVRAALHGVMRTADPDADLEASLLADDTTTFGRGD